MASRKEQKEQARARREAEERARAARAAPRRRLRMVGGVSSLAVAVVAVLIAVSSGGGSSTPACRRARPRPRPWPRCSSCSAGIPQSGATLGNPTAPVTMTYYGDLECPICRDFTLNGGFAPLVANEVRAGKVKIVYKALRDRHQGPQRLQDPAGRRARRRPAAALLELRRALLPRAGRRGHGLRQRELPHRPGQPDPRLQPRPSGSTRPHAPRSPTQITSRRADRHARPACRARRRWS